VAKPELAPDDITRVYARPDDLSENGKSWREVLLDYNERPGNNPLGLLPAYRLYENPAYVRLAEAFGLENLYILSAGWGLIRATFLTPQYDITFSQSADAYKRRRKSDRYRDFCMLPRQVDKEIVFLGGKDYIPLFDTITSGIQGKRTVFFNSAFPPDAPGCTLKRFLTSTRTNWHYECANLLSREQTPFSGDCNADCSQS
jgi:hypothetical protein